MITKSQTAKFVAGFVGIATAVSFAVTPVVASAATVAELQAMIASLSAQLSAMNTTTGSMMTSAYTFNTNLTVGSKGTDVMNLQKVLNMSSDTMVASTGAGSPGHETSTFGPATKAAVVKFQVKNGISPTSGYVGPITRAKLNSMSGSMTTTTGTTSTTTSTTLPTGGALMVAPATQPVNSLAPQSAARVPFTSLTLTAGSSDVTVNSITVQRSGLAQDAVFSGIVLLGQNGMQIGVAKTLNSNHQTMVGEPWVIKAGTSQTVTIAGNMSSSLSSYSGQVVGLDVVAINTSATVSGSLPITGAQHTVNSTLSLGSVTMNISSFDPNSSQTKEIGTTAYKFAGVRITAGSAEAVKLWSIRWNQSGSASSNDLANVVVNVGGTAYPTVVSADGKYYSATFPGGIFMDKGNSQDIYIQGDIVGTGASGRTVKFDLYKTTDLYLSGVTYMYGITPPVGVSSTVDGSISALTNTTPWFSGSKVTVSAGSVTTIAKATSVAAQNIAVNVPNQVLGGFTTDIKGEPISVQSMVFNIATSGTGAGLLTNVTIVDSNNAVVAGPVDATGAGSTLTFTDTVTFPVGQKTYTLKGKLPSGFTNNGTLVLSSNPSTGWTNVLGQTTGNTISLSSNGSFSMNTMTVKAAALAITVSATPSVQSIVAGGQGVMFANYQFDASQSGEDVRFSTIPLKLTFGGLGVANHLSSCQLWDGTTALNTGSNVVNPAASVTTGSDVTFTLDQSYTVAKGAVKTLTLTCNVSASSASAETYNWGIQAAPSISVTGVTSSNTVSQTVSASVGQIQTVAAGYLTVTTDSNSPSYAVVAAGTTGNILGSFKFRATNESINLNKLGLKLTSTASSSAQDLTQVTIWDGSTQVGAVVFTGANSVATTTFSTPVLLTKDTDKILTLKGDLSAIGVSSPGTEGHLILVDINGSDTTGTQGTGVGSGNTINLATAGSSASTAVSGVRVFKSFPTFAKLSVPTNTLNNGEQSLLRFSISSNSAGDSGIYKFTLHVATTTATVTGINIRAYTDSSFSTPVSGLTSDGSMLQTNLTGTAWASSATDLEVFAQNASGASTTVQVPAGQTRYFNVIGTVAGAVTGASVQTQLQGDAAYPQLASFMGTALQVNNDAGSNNDFIWSPNATSTSVNASNDWTNGYGLVGLPAANMSAEVLSK